MSDRERLRRSYLRPMLAYPDVAVILTGLAAPAVTLTTMSVVVPLAPQTPAGLVVLAGRRWRAEFQQHLHSAACTVLRPMAGSLRRSSRLSHRHGQR